MIRLNTQILFASFLFILSPAGRVFGAQLVDTIQLAGNASPVSLAYADNNLFVGQDSTEDTLLCIELPGETASWSRSFQDWSEKTVTPTQLAVTANSDLVFGISGISSSLRAFDTDDGSLVADHELVEPLHIRRVEVGSQELLCTVCENGVDFFNATSGAALLSVALPLGGKPWSSEFDTDWDTLLIPLFGLNKIAGIRLQWNQGLVFTYSEVIGGDRPLRVVAPPGNADFWVYCDGSVGQHDKLSLQPHPFAFFGIASVSDARYHSGKALVTSFHNPSGPMYNGGYMIHTVGGVPGPPNRITTSYPLSICETDIPNEAHCIDRGLGRTTSGCHPGELWTIDLQTGLITDVDVLGGLNEVSCYDTSTNKLYIAEPTLGHVKVFQL